MFQPGKTFYFHTKEFIQGYIGGWCSVFGPGHGMDENETSFDYNKAIKDPESADWYIYGGRPELHGTDYRDRPQPLSGVKGNENNSN